MQSVKEAQIFFSYVPKQDVQKRNLRCNFLSYIRVHLFSILSWSNAAWKFFFFFELGKIRPQGAVPFKVDIKTAQCQRVRSTQTRCSFLMLIH